MRGSSARAGGDSAGAFYHNAAMLTKPPDNSRKSASHARTAPLGFRLGAGLTTAVIDALEAERDRWSLWAPVGLIFGIAAYFALPFEPPLAVTVLAALAGLAGLSITPAARRPAALIFLLPVAGMLLAQIRTEFVAAPILEQEMRAVEVEGIVDLVELRGGDDRRLVIAGPRVEGLVAARTPARLRVTARTDTGGAAPGDRVSLLATLEPPPEPVAPDAFDFARQAYFERLGAVGYALSDVEILERGRLAALWQRIHRLRLHIAERVQNAVPGPEGALSAALLTGLRGAIPEEDSEAMRIAGLAHLLAISGLHVGLVTAAAFFFVRAALAAIPAIARRRDVKPLAAAVAWLVALAYLLLAGATLPTQRAVLMASVVLLALLLGREPISLRLVAFAAMVILLLSPEAALSASFQMSFAAVVALVAVYQWAAPQFARLRRGAGRPRRLALYLLGVILTTLVAEAAIAPFAAFHFNRLTVYGLLANLVAVPVMAFWVMPVGLLALLLMPFGLDAPFLAIMGAGAAIVLETAREVAALPGSVQPAPSFPGLVLFCGTLGLLWLLLWRSTLLKALAALPLGAAAILAALNRPPDLLIARNGDLFAVNRPEALYVSSLRAARYDREQWTRITGHLEALHWREAGELIACDDLGCTIDLGHFGGEGSLAIALTPAALVADCRRADALIAAMPVRPGARCRRPGLVIDRFDVWRSGAHALHVTKESLKIRSAADSRGQRPWVRRRPGGGAQ